MDGSQVLSVGLATLSQALKARKLVLLDELRQVECDLESVEHTAAAADRMGLSKADLDGTQPARAAVVPSRQAHTLPSTGTERSVVDDLRLREAALDSIGSIRDDKSIPSRLDERGRPHDLASLPKDHVGMRVLHDSVQCIAEKAAELPCGPGARKHTSVLELVLGEPITPVLRRVLAAADRPLTTGEVTAAFLQVRGLNIQGRDLSALSNQVSALLSKVRMKGQAIRTRREDSSGYLWSKPG